MKQPLYNDQQPSTRRLYGLWMRVASAPSAALMGLTLLSLTVAFALIVEGAMLIRPTGIAIASNQPPPLIIVAPAEDATPTPTSTAVNTPTIAPSPEASPDASVTIPAMEEAPSPTATTPPTDAPPTPTTVPLDTILMNESEGSPLQQEQWLSILLLGKDARPDEQGPTRTDTIMVAVLNLEAGNITLISIPRDVWAPIAGYGYARINTAYFLGEMWGNGRETAANTVSQVLGIPITHTAVIDFNGFRELVNAMGGIDIEVPDAIDDPYYPDENYGYEHLQIAAGAQHMDGDLALKYARTRHGDSDIHRAARQQAVLQAIRARLLTPEQLPSLPSYLALGAQQIETDFSLPDLFYLARFARVLDTTQIRMHVLQPPTLWDGWTTDGQQVLFYDPYTLQQEVQGWLNETTQPAEELAPLDN